MAIVTLDVRPLEDTLTDLAQVCTIGQPDTGPRISFAIPALLWQVLTARRWDLLKALTGQAPMSLREVARRAECDVKAVHGGVHALLRPGVLTKTAQRKIVFPYDGIHIDFTLRAA
jgi:predicted transcriptional regulator